MHWDQLFDHVTVFDNAFYQKSILSACKTVSVSKGCYHVSLTKVSNVFVKNALSHFLQSLKKLISFKTKSS